MKTKSIAILAFFVLFAFNKSFSQCTPFTFPGTGFFYPDTLTGLMDGAATGQYSATIHFKIPLTALIQGQQIPIDSAKIESVSGLPNSLSFAANSSNSTYKSGIYGCGEISGTLAANTVGNHPLTFNLKVLVGSMWLPYTFTGFSIEVLDASHVGFFEGGFLENSIATFYNPQQKSVEVQFASENKSQYKIQLLNVLGQVVFESNYQECTKYNNFSISNMEYKSGLYIIRVAFENNEVLSQKLILP